MSTAPALVFPMLLAMTSIARAQHPLRHYTDAVETRYARAQPVVGYTLRVDTADLAAFAVEMRIRNVPDTFRLAMVAHPEYDDRYWRFVDSLSVSAPAGVASIVSEDSALWRVVAPGGEAVVRYRLRLPTPPEVPRAAWRPHLAATGGLVGGAHSFLYVVGATLAPAHVTLELPPGWETATGLVPTADPATFFAPSVAVLIDSPVLVGRFSSWRFALDGVPHRVVYWPLAQATPFDTAAFVGNLQRLVRQTVALFGRAPYREYAFLFQDGAYGGLEHRNSVTLGAPSADLAQDAKWLLAETAHEYIHTWNLMRIHPAEYGDVDYRTQRRTRGLWWSEGLTLFYADLLLRRAALPVADSTRAAHLERLIGRYFGNPGNARIAPEQVSLVAYGAPPGSLGDYTASVHLQGELLATMLDLIVRDATDGRRSMDDVMRAMLDRFSGERGFAGTDIERTVADVCGCDVRSFFESHVRNGQAIDFDRYLRLIGLRVRLSWKPALSSDGQPAADLRLFAWLPPGERYLSLLLSDPTGAWGRAGLHTGDRILSVNGAPLATMDEFRALRRRLRIGDSVQVAVQRPAGAWNTTVVVTGYDQPVARIETIAEATERQRTLRERWVAGTP
jgi:predicted metalloprotease with PDZ domain